MNTLKFIGSIYEFDLKDYVKAKEYYDQWIAGVPESAEFHNYYALFLIGHCLPKFKDLAIKHYERACELDSKFQHTALDIRLYYVKDKPDDNK